MVSIDLIREVVKLMKTEEELRSYLNTLPYNKRGRCPEYQDLKNIVDARHKDLEGKCANCGHGGCHAYAGIGEKVTGKCSSSSCDCVNCLCRNCDLNWGINGI